MSLSFTKVMFGIIIFGILITGFIQVGNDLNGNTNLDSGTQDYLSSLNESTQGIQDLQMNQTDVNVGTEDSFAKQYIESKLYAQRAAGMLSVVGDTPGILIQATGLETGEAQWFLNYIYLGIGILTFAVLMYMLFGRKF